MTEMAKAAKIDTLFMTKTADKPYPLEPHLHSPYKEVRPRAFIACGPLQFVVPNK